LDHGEELLPLSLDDSGHNQQDHLAIVDPYKLVGRTFLMDPQDDGQHFLARIVDLVEDHQSKVCKSDNHYKFRISVNDNQYEEVITYNELMDFIQKNEEKIPLSGIFGESSDTKDHFFALITTTRVLNSMLWLNGRMGSCHSCQRPRYLCHLRKGT
jgi:hypothetical protein